MPKLSLVFETILYWAVLTLLMFIPLFMKFPMVGVGGTFVAIRFEDILIALTYLLWAVYLIVSGKIKSFFKDKLNQAILVFFFIGSISLFSAIFVSHTATLHLGILHLLRRVEVMMLLPLAISVIKNKRQAFVYLGALSLVLLITNGYALGQRYLGFPAVSTTNSELSKGVVYFIKPFGRIVSTFGGHYDLAVFLVMALSLISAVFFYLLKSNLLLSLWLGFLAAISAVVLVMTAARLSFVAGIAGVVGSLILVGEKKYILAILILAGLALLYPSQLRDRFISTFTVNIKKSWTSYFSNKDISSQRSKLNIPTLPLTWQQQSAENEATPSVTTTEPVSADIVPGEPTDITDLGVFRSFEIRFNVEWPRAIQSFIKNPLLGSGYSSIGLATDNDFLRSLGEVGLLGTMAFLLILIEVIKRLLAIYNSIQENSDLIGDELNADMSSSFGGKPRSLERGGCHRRENGLIKYLAAGTLSMIFAFLVNGLFIDVFEASKTASLFWLILGIGLALGGIADTKAETV